MRAVRPKFTSGQDLDLNSTKNNTTADRQECKHLSHYNEEGEGLSAAEMSRKLGNHRLVGFLMSSCDRLPQMMTAF